MAPQVGVTGKVVGLDFSAERLSVARSQTPTQGAEVEWREGDAMTLPFADAEFNLVCCHQGLQFFPDRLAAIREMFRVLIPGGRLLLSVWRSIEHHLDAVAMAAALQRHVSAEAASVRNEIFSLGDAETIEGLLDEAGFREIVIRPIIKTLSFPSAEAFTTRYISAVGPLARMVSEVDDITRTAILEDMSVALQSYINSDGLAIPTASHLVTAHA